MNFYFYSIFLPYSFLSVFGIFCVINSPSLIIYTIFFWFFIGPIGLGIGFHRLFSHRQFTTYRSIEIILAIFGTLSAYGPLKFWVASHQCHHKYTDTERDPTSPTRGFWHSTLTWNLKKQCQKEIVLRSYPVIQVLKDKQLSWLSENFFILNYIFLICFLLIDYEVALAGYVVATTIERIRIGFFVNYMLHKNVIGSYKSDKSSDNSVNFPWLYPLTIGFSFHNQHHINSKNLSEKSRWYEIDLEYHLCKLISKND